MWYLLMGSGLESTTLISCFFGRNNPLDFQQHDETFGYGHYSSMGWPWTHHQKSDETRAAGASIVPASLGGGIGDDKELVWEIYLEVLSNIQLLLNVFEPTDKVPSSHDLTCQRFTRFTNFTRGLNELLGDSYWNFHKFLSTVEQNCRTRRVIPLNEQCMHRSLLISPGILLMFQWWRLLRISVCYISYIPLMIIH